METIDASPSLRAKKMTATRTSIVTAVLRLGSKGGLENVTVREIAAEADIGSRTFFRFFSSKEDAVVSLEREFFEAIAESLREQSPSNLASAFTTAFTAAASRFNDGWWDRFASAARLMTASPTVDARAMRLCDDMSNVFGAVLRPSFDTMPEHELHIALDAVFSAWRRARREWLTAEELRPADLHVLVHRNVQFLASAPLI